MGVTYAGLQLFKQIIGGHFEQRIRDQEHHERDTAN